MLRVRVLGELALEVDGHQVELPASRRARALAGLFALERRIHPRSDLAARFWPEVLDESARTSLRSALSSLRKALGPGGECYVIADRDGVGFAGEDLVWTDVGEFASLEAAGRDEDALALVRGDVLSGLDDEWVYGYRDEFRERVSALLGRLAAWAQAAGDLAGAVRLSRRQAAVDPLAEEPHRALMRRLVVADDRAGALAVYARLSDRLREQMHIAPSAATRALAEAIRSEEDDQATPPTQRAAVAAPVATGTVTLLFTDLVGSTELLQALGDEAAERLRRAHFGLLRDVAAAHNGREVKSLGDGLMVVFTSALDAVGCAVAMQQAVHRHNAREKRDWLRVRVGLHVGEPIRAEDDYFGTPVVVAKRLCDRAQGGQILVSDLVRALIGSRGGFAFAALGPLALKGIAEPVPACVLGWEPTGAVILPLPGALTVGAEAGLVGRAAELDRLHAAWTAARAGRRRIVLLAGEPGIGKTRLAAELCRAAHAEGATVLLGSCFEEGGRPYGPFVDALNHYVSACPTDELRLVLGDRRSVLAQLVPELGAPGTPAATLPSIQGDERARHQLFEAVAFFLREAAAIRPVIVLLDDLQWADASTLLLLRHIARSIPDVALLLLGTYRETELDETHPLTATLAELRRARAMERIDVAGLPLDDVAQLIVQRAGGPTPEGFANAVYDRTEGNPFFVEELLRDATPIGAQTGWSGALARLSVPESVKDVLVRRLRRLDEPCRRALAAAAVMGREFDLDVLERVTETDAAELAETLEDAIAAQVIGEVADTLGRYAFAHALIRETLYDAISATRRATLHRRIVDAIESQDGQRLDEQAAALAYHCDQAGDLERALTYHARAAAAARRVHAAEPALEHYRTAIDAGRRLGLTAQHERLRRLLIARAMVSLHAGGAGYGRPDWEEALAGARAAGDRHTELQVLNELGIAHRIRGFADAIRYHDGALALAEELGDNGAQVVALSGLSLVYANQLDLDHAVELGERALAIAQALGDDSLVAQAMDALKQAALQLGDLERLTALTAQLERIQRARDEPWYLQWTLLESAFIPLAAGRFDEALGRVQEALAINHRIVDPATLPLLHDAQCWMHRTRGDYEKALAAGRQAVALARQAPERTWEGWTAATYAAALMDLRAPEEAAAVLEAGLAPAEQASARAQVLRCTCTLAWARWLLGDAESARALAQCGEALVTAARLPDGRALLFAAGAQVALARVLLGADEPECGERLLEPLLAAARRSGWNEPVATSALVLGLCRLARGADDDAVALLAEAAHTARVGGLPAPEWEARAALGQLHRDRGRQTDADAEIERGRGLVKRLASTVADPATRERFLTAALSELAGAATT